MAWVHLESCGNTCLTLMQRQGVLVEHTEWVTVSNHLTEEENLSDQAWFRSNHKTNLQRTIIKETDPNREQKHNAQGWAFLISYEYRGKDWGCDLLLKPLILPTIQRLSDHRAGCSQGLGLGETIALWLSSQCNQMRDEYRGIKFQCFGHRPLTHRNQSLWERILSFILDSRVYGSLSRWIQFPSVSQFREGWLLFSLFLEQCSAFFQSLPTQQIYSHSLNICNTHFVLSLCCLSLKMCIIPCLKCLEKTIHKHGLTQFSSHTQCFFLSFFNTDSQNEIKHFQQSTRQIFDCVVPQKESKQINHFWITRLTSDARSMMQTTHICFLLDDLQDPLCRKQEVDEAAEAVSSVLPLHNAEKLPQNSGSSDGEGSVQGRQGALDTVI